MSGRCAQAGDGPRVQSVRANAAPGAGGELRAASTPRPNPPHSQATTLGNVKSERERVLVGLAGIAGPDTSVVYRTVCAQGSAFARRNRRMGLYQERTEVFTPNSSRARSPNWSASWCGDAEGGGVGVPAVGMSGRTTTRFQKKKKQGSWGAKVKCLLMEGQRPSDRQSLSA